MRVINKLSSSLKRRDETPNQELAAENALPVIDQKNKAVFIKTLTARLNEIEKETKRTWVEKVIKKLQLT